jgi:predicted acetyltransferase
MHKLRAVDPAPIRTDEIPDFVRSVFHAFHYMVPEDEVEARVPNVEAERTLVLRDDGRIVAAASIFTRELTVPGAVVPLAAVTMVGVQPTHRRRGMLTALMRRQLADVHEGGREAIAALWASEAAIYGRFGYGIATLSAELDITKPDALVRSAPSLPATLHDPADAVDAMRAVHDAVRPTVPGMLDRHGNWWRTRLRDPERDRRGAEPLRAAVVDGVAYALFAIKRGFEHGRPAGEVRVREVLASTPAGHAAIWDFLLALDLTIRVVWDGAPVDEPLPHTIGEARAVRAELSDGLWLRVVDLPRALSERTYGEPFEVVLEVADDVCPWNAGRWALRWDGSAATCARTSLPAALALSSAELSAAYLGGTTLELLARAGRVEELRTGALAPVSHSFAGLRAPWCPEIF